MPPRRWKSEGEYSWEKDDHEGAKLVGANWSDGSG